MKIMMIITGMKSGGAERVMATLCNELVKIHKIKLVVMKTAASDYELDPSVELVGGNIKNQSFIKSVLFTKMEIEQWVPDVILSFMTKSNIIALTAERISKCNIPVIIAERANPYCTPILYKLIRRMVYPWASNAVFQTVQAQEYYKKILKYGSVVLKNPLNTDFDIKPYTGERKKKIVTVGRLSKLKNQRLLIDAFAKIADKYSDYVVEIYGEGPLCKKLLECIKEHGLQDRVLLMGRKKNIQNYIIDAEIFVLPSNSEGMPNALIEAMALGMACIATDCPIGGSAVVIQNGENGILTAVNDANLLAKNIAELIDNKKYSENLRRNALKITQKFNAKKVCAEWERYLRKVVDEYNT